MAVLPTKTVPACKICKSEHRADIEALLERRSKREKDDDGNLINGEYVLEKMREWGVPNPTTDNIKSHWRPGTDSGHCEVVTERDANAVADAVSANNQEMLDILDASDGSVDGDLRAIFKVGMRRIRGRIVQGGDPGVSVDHALKASAELTKRRDSETKHQLLAALGAGMQTALEQRKAPKQIEGAEVIEAEAVEVEA